MNSTKIEPSKTTVQNSFDITLENEDYTFGKVIEFILYNRFYKTGTFTYSGFKKFHPHDLNSVIRIAFSTHVEKESVGQYLIMACNDAKDVYEKIIALF